ncbi:MAG TPA: DHCW motif cupin fold protein [Chryseosolibacter sp.]
MATIPYQTTDWQQVSPTSHRGETGEAKWQTLQYGSLRIRKVTLSAHYKADHWCAKGHITYCLEGEFTSELSDGTIHTLKAGMSYQVSDGQSVHRSSSLHGATMLIIDGEFLQEQKRTINPWKM